MASIASSQSDAGLSRVNVGSYDVVIGHGLLASLPKRILALKKAAKYVLLSDENVFPLFGASLLQAFSELGATVYSKVIPAGEASKTRATKAEIEDWMLDPPRTCGRDTIVITMGGGVITDLGGFVASTYMRGVPVVHIPTTLLAMVDAAIGGKTGVDTPAGKNLVGTFHQPLAVFVDPLVLKTLPMREFCNGMAEIIKAGAIASQELFMLLENQSEAIMGLDMPLLTRVISESARIKAEVVKADEKEGDYRSVLNFGHTIGHAIEGWMQPRLLHGECVAIGMIEEAIVARSMGFVSTAAIRRLDNICRAYRLPVEVPAELSVSQLMQKMAVDKKNKDSMIKMVILTSIGKVKANPYTTAVPDALLHRLLCPAASVLPTVARGRVLVPGSKSASNRVLLMAAMAQGTCRIRGLLHSEDTQVMLDSLRRLGVEFSWEENEEVLVMHGSGGQLRVPSSEAPLYLENAGTAARFLTTLCCLVPAPVTLTGSKRMKERPISDLADALSGAGASIEYLESKGCLPIRVSSPGGLRGGPMTLSAAVSSQFVSSVLLSAPYAREPVTLTLEGQVVSEPYIEMTLQLMRQFGVSVQRPQPQTFVVPRGVYRVPSEYTVEGDASSATYPLAIAAITGGSVTVCNVGGSSLQGDAQFCHLLARMGCQVSQTDIETTVTGPPARARSSDGLSVLDGSPTGLRALGEVDMSAMTDSFLTLSVLAAAASGTTRIVNIANQRVKECNRIRAMCELLGLCGVHTRELETGLEIQGAGDVSRLRGAVIDCHNDHRIAMSFATLGCLVPGVVLDQKACVNKTYPEFWDHLERCLAVKLDPTVSVALERLSAAEREASRQREALSTLSLPAGGPRFVLIGMRGVGKTTLGMAAARHLGLRFVDMDAALEAELGAPIREWVQAHSWPEFRAAEIACLKRVLAAYPNDSVISCGGGIIETPEAVSVLQKEAFAVEIQRHAEDVVAYLTADSSRPSLGEHPGSVYERRRPLYRAASRFEFRIRRGDFDWPNIEKDLVCFLATVAGLRTTFTTVGNPAAVRPPLTPSFGGSVPPGVQASLSPSVAAVGSQSRLPAHTLLWTLGGARRRPISQARGTFFLSLSVGDVKELDWSNPHLLAGADAVEFRADLLANCPSVDSVIEQLLIVRRRVFPLPIIFTVRSASQGGRFPDDEAAIFELLHAALRHGCQLVDMECSWGAEARRRLLDAKGRAEVIGSMHLPRSNGGSESQLRALFDQCSQNGQCDVVKVVVTASSPDDAVRISHVAREWTRDTGHAAVIALAMGPQGKLSRVVNQVLCPVTSPSLPVPAAPGQMTVAEIQHTRSSIGLVTPRRFFLFGSPIARSPSPAMHNAGFRECLLPHTYELFDTSDPEALRQVLSAPDFGGASVTIPLKERVAPLLARLSPAAARIGAVNTIIREDDGSLTGDNTDWIGILRPLRAVLQPDQFLPTANPRSKAVVVGAGGTARAAVFALQQLGFAGDRVVVWNRTAERAAAIARELGCSADYDGLTRALSSPAPAPSVSVAVVVVTLPGSAEYSVPPLLLGTRPVLFDVCYFPKETAWSREALAAGCPIVKGIDMIIAQGVAQFELWTGKAFAAAAMDSAARKLFAAME